MTSAGQLAIYEYMAWKGYLLPALAPGALRVTARLEQSSGDVLGQIPSSCRSFAFHINLTFAQRLPGDRLQLLDALRARGVHVWNADAVDISKRSLQAACARLGLPTVRAERAGDPDELVLIKTNYNFHGLKESGLSRAERSALGYEEPRGCIDADGGVYKVQRRSEVLDDVWKSNHWVVERYISNRSDEFHRVYLAGSSLVLSRVVDASRFKKMPEGIARTSWFFRIPTTTSPTEGETRPELVAHQALLAARAMNIDFGALDVVSDDAGAVFVVDVNTTPYWGAGGHPELLAHLRAGLERSHNADW